MRRHAILAGAVGLVIGASGAWVGNGLAMQDSDHGDTGHMDGGQMDRADDSGGHDEHGMDAGPGDEHGHGDDAMSMEVPEDATPATRAFIEANDAMHGAMAIEFSGDADVDFVRGMIPHHEGAIAMAEIVLEHGADAEIAELAREIITAQRSEIAWMEEWLAEHAD